MIKFIGTNYEKFIFFNGKYYFALNHQWIVKGWASHINFHVNEDICFFNSEIEKDKYCEKRVSSKQINRQIKLIRKEYPEFLL